MLFTCQGNVKPKAVVKRMWLSGSIKMVLLEKFMDTIIFLR